MKNKLPSVYNIDNKEISAVVSAMRKGPLSGFVANWDETFFGGPEVKKLEAYASKVLNMKEVVSFNSATTALQAAVSALGIGPGDEVIVPPYTMSATATCVLANGAVPVFADIDEKTFCLDPDKIEKSITKYTKAIIVVNLFGGPADFKKLLIIARKRKLKIIEDNAQAFGSKYKGKLTGTIGDIGVFSLNVHKIIQSGEGGLLVTNNKNYAMRARLCRNHGEVIADQIKDYKYGPIMGSNFRMTEITAAIAIEQIKKVKFLTNHRIKLAKYLAGQIIKIPGLTPPFDDKSNKHVYYLFPIKFDKSVIGIKRDVFVDAMKAEGFPMSKGYVKPIYLMRLFQEKRAYNKTSFPFESAYNPRVVDYSKGLCPTSENLWKNELTFTDICQYPRTNKHIDLFVEAAKKVIENKNELSSR